jgi:DNA-binding transcriptional LysR family regulator
MVPSWSPSTAVRHDVIQPLSAVGHRAPFRRRPRVRCMARIAEPRITLTARDWPTRVGLVAAGLGIALVPGIAAPAVPRGVR